MPALVWEPDTYRPDCARGRLPKGHPVFWLMAPTRRVRSWRLFDYWHGLPGREERLESGEAARLRAADLIVGHLAVVGAVPA